MTNNNIRQNSPDEDAPSQMTPEERAAFEHAMAERDRLTRELAAERESLESLESRRHHIESEIRSLHQQIAAAEARSLEMKIEALVGKKFTAEELPEMLRLGRELGLPRMMRLLASRPDLRFVRPNSSPPN